MANNQFYQDIADGYYNAGIHYLNKARAVHEAERLDKIYDYIAINLQPGEIHDKEDLISYVAKFKSLQRVIGYLYEARPQNSCDWFLPLLKECYMACGVAFNKRAIFTMPNGIPHGYNIFYEAFRDSAAPSVDIFIIPHMADFDLGSIALVGHEVGHILIGQNISIVRSEIKKYLQHVKGIDVSALGKDKKLGDFVDRSAKHISEYLCDIVGSRLFGPAFDLSFLRMFLAEINVTNPTDSHPAIIHRMKLALNRMFAIKSCDQSLNLALENIKNTMDNLCRDCKHYEPKESEKDLQQLAKDIFSSYFSKRIKPIDLDGAWKKVTPELDGFRPPCETVNNAYPIPITPREIVVSSSIYYYGHAYANNDYYKNSIGAEEHKNKIIKQSLAKHAKYAIELSDFVFAAHNQLDQDQKNRVSAEVLHNTLWMLRSNEEDQLVVVPSISPGDQYSRNAIDLRLGSYFLVNKLPLFTHVQPRKFYNNKEEQIAFEFGMFDPVHVPIGKDFILHPHQFILACTLEYICLPKDKYAFVLGRSTWGRLGLNIATATTVQPGFRGCLTLELRNLGETPLPLTVGTRIAQIAVVSVPEGVPLDDKEYFSAASKYIGPVGVGLPKIQNDPDWKIIKAFTDR